MSQISLYFGLAGLIIFAWSTILYDPSMKMYGFILRFNKIEENNQESLNDEAMVALSGVSYTAHAAGKAALRAVILGAPGSGKGTISARIVKQFSVTHISSGDKLRLHIANQTALGKEVKKYLDSGSFVPDETMIALISEEIKLVEGCNWLLDGFPRTERQAEMLDSMHPVSLVINLEVPDSVVLERVRNRWTHLPSGRVYNIGFNDPKEPGKDDLTGERLCRRPDDEPQVVQQRLHEFKTKTSSVIRYYEKRGVLRSFAGITTDEMWSDIVEYIHNFFS